MSYLYLDNPKKFREIFDWCSENFPDLDHLTGECKVAWCFDYTANKFLFFDKQLETMFSLRWGDLNK